MLLRRSAAAATAAAAAAAAATAAAATADAAAAPAAENSAPHHAEPITHHQLIHASIFFRHGARAPVHHTFPGMEGIVWDDCDSARSAPLMHVSSRLTDAHGHTPPPPSKVDAAQQSVVLPGGCRQGELTTTGVLQAHGLGTALRARYSSLLPQRSSEPASLEVRSTNVSRCVATARAVLHGLLGPDDRSPIAILTVANDSEDLTPAPRRCARLAEMWDEARTEWSRHANAMHALSARTTSRLRSFMDEPALAAYGVETGRWVRSRTRASCPEARPFHPHPCPHPHSGAAQGRARLGWCAALCGRCHALRRACRSRRGRRPTRRRTGRAPHG